MVALQKYDLEFLRLVLVGLFLVWRLIVLLAIFCSTCDCLKIHFRLESAVMPCDAFLQVSSLAIPESTAVRWEDVATSTLIVDSNSTSQGRFTLESQSYSLQISDLGIEDSRQYRCIVEGKQRIPVEPAAPTPIAGTPANVIDDDSTTPLVTRDPSPTAAKFPPKTNPPTDAPPPTLALLTTATPPPPTDTPLYEEIPFRNESTIQLEVREPMSPGTPFPLLDGIMTDAVKLTWTPSDGPVMAYAVHYGPDYSTVNGTFRATSNNVTTVEGLQPFTDYVFWVEALFTPGYNKSGPPSNVIQTAQGTPLLPPTNFTAVAEGPRQIRVTWAPPPEDSLQGTLQNYVVKYYEELKEIEMHRTTENTTYILTSFVKPFKTYVISVAVRNSALMTNNIGPYSEELFVTTAEDIPSAPVNLRVFNVVSNEIVVLWDRPNEENGQILFYSTYLEGKGMTETKRVKGRVHAYPNKEPYTEYFIHVSASTSVGEGPNATISVRTAIAGANKPEQLAVSGITNSSALLTWKQPTVYYKSIDAYVVSYWEGNMARNATRESVEFAQRKTLSGLEPAKLYYATVHAVTHDKGEDIDGDRSDVLSFKTLANNNGVSGPGTGAVPGSERSTAGMVLLVLFLILLVVLLLVLGYYGIVARKRHQMSLLNQHSGLRPIFAFSKPDELEEPPIPVDRFEEHVIANHADSDGHFATEYEDIQNVGTNFPAQAGLEDGNKLKNRYTNIVAYDHTRVCLQTLPGHPDSHYINANYIDSYNAQCAYIATQGPLKNTIEDFWRMVWEQKCHIIVMITKLEERGRRKCERYWPPKGMAERFRDIEVSLDGKEKFCTYVLRTFHLKYKPRRHGKAQERVVKHYHYIDWPDHGVPSHTLPVLDFVQRSSEANPKDGGPIIVHCSAGVGRTGTYIVIDSMLKQIQDCSKVNVFGFLKRIRTQRNYLVQTEEQYVFIHDVLLEWVKAGDTRIKVENLKEYAEKMDLPDENGVVALDVQHEQIMQQKIHAYQFMRARNPMNKPKNRSSQVLPVERGRVTITGQAGVEHSDYINASFLHGYWHHNAFIVTQHPMETTMLEFWKMLWEKNCTTVVMLTCKDKDQDSVYWPTKKEEPLDFDCLKVTLLEEELSNIEFVTRDFLVESSQEEDPLQIRQYSCSYWPEGCSPIHTTFDLIYAVQKFTKQTEGGNKDMIGPIVVHDKCGGRQAGTFCALMALHEEMREEETVNVYKTIKQYTATRVGMFNRKEDYHFLYRALASAYTTQKQLLTIERQKANNRSKSRRIHRDWSFMVRSPVNTMEFRPHVERRNSFDGEEFRGRSQTLGSTGRVARPTKFWHRRAKSEKPPSPAQVNGDVKTGSEKPPEENGHMEGGEFYDIESLQSSETDRMLERDYPSEADIANIDQHHGTKWPDLMITAADLQRDMDAREKSSSTNSLDRLIAYRQEVDRIKMNGGGVPHPPAPPPLPSYQEATRRPKSWDVNGTRIHDMGGGVTYAEDYV